VPARSDAGLTSLATQRKVAVELSFYVSSGQSTVVEGDFQGSDVKYQCDAYVRSHRVTNDSEHD